MTYRPKNGLTKRLDSSTSNQPKSHLVSFANKRNVFYGYNPNKIILKLNYNPISIFAESEKDTAYSHQITSPEIIINRLGRYSVSFDVSINGAPAHFRFLRNGVSIPGCSCFGNGSLSMRSIIKFDYEDTFSVEAKGVEEVTRTVSDSIRLVIENIDD